MDTTREVALALQQGIKEAKGWKWGPFAAGYVLTPRACCYFAQIGFSPSIQLVFLVPNGTT